MNRHRFSLETVLQVRRRARDACQMQLAGLVARLQAIENQEQQLLTTRSEQLEYLRDISQSGLVDLDQVSRCQKYLARLDTLQRVKIMESEAARLAVSASRQRLLEADQLVNALEKLKEKQLLEQAQVQARRDARELEDVWSAIYQRNSRP